ncbi:hypothetical protein EDB80DRAFT_720041 [Ilyonectria destructans]|nr:hypothetical protein EDB80DRAFT_720041 [Ilyonectria destructans]
MSSKSDQAPSDSDSDELHPITTQHAARTTPDGKPRANVIEKHTILGERFKITEWVGSVNHAEVYAVEDLGEPAVKGRATYEARVYELRDLSDSLEGYRTRSMRRLSKRSVFRTSWNGLHVIIYKTGNLEDHSDATLSIVGANKDGASPDIDSASTKTVAKAKKKTVQKQESDRLRQRERRRRNQQSRRQAEDDDSGQSVGNRTDPNPQSEPRPQIQVDEREFVFFQILDLTHRPPAFRERAPPGLRQAVDKYLATKDIDVLLDDEDALAEYTSVKEREIVSLRRQYNKFQPVLEQWHGQLKVMRENQAKFKPGSIEWNKRENERVEPMSVQCSILESGLDLLPKIITAAEEKVESLKPKLLAARQAKEERVEKQTTKLERKRLNKRIKQYEKWIYGVPPGSETYAWMQKELESAEKRLEEMDRMKQI